MTRPRLLFPPAAAVAGRCLAVLLVLGAFGTGHAGAQQADAYARSSSGTRELTLAGGTQITMLLEAANLGDASIEVAEITFPVGTDPSRGHRHGATEIFYVVDGVLEHVVNGVAYRLEPGMLGVVRPGDEVEHRVLSDVPVKAVVMWVPGGEADRIAPPERWRSIRSDHGADARPSLDTPPRSRELRQRQQIRRGPDFQQGDEPGR